MKYYECHITMIGIPHHIKPIVEESNWFFSCIDGDINLGKGIKCYATKQFNTKKYTEDDLLKLLKDISEGYKQKGVKIKRIKVEMVLIDIRYR